MPPWLARLLGVGGPTLKDSITQVLSRDSSFNNEIAPHLEGGRFNPLTLDSLLVEAQQFPSEPQESVVDRRQTFVDRARQMRESPIMTDTIADLVGGRVRMGVNHKPDLYSIVAFGEPGKAAGVTSAYTRNVAIEAHPGIADEGTIFHEVGHVGDLRNALPELESLASRNYGLQRERFPDSYAASSKKEYTAELFAYALDLIRDSEERLTESQRVFPDDPEMSSPQGVLNEILNGARKEGTLVGLDEAVVTLLRRPIFQNSRLGRALADREFLLNSVGSNRDQFFIQ
jgi:hypothetical protein